jgi:hypothetical protein
MIWWNLIFFAVSFVLTALLTPKPEFEDARADSLDPENFPRATEDAPVPLLLGCAKIKGPNTLWYGDYEAVPIKEKVKTGLFSSTTIVKGHKYYLSLDLGLCLGPEVQLKKVFIDSEEVVDGSAFYEEEEIALYEDNEVLVNVGGGAGPNYKEVSDLLLAVGLSATEFDALAEQGLIQVRCRFLFSATLTPLAGGGDADGSWQLQTNIYDALALGGDQIFPDAGVGLITEINTNPGGGSLEVVYALPVGARSIRFGAYLAPTIPLFTIIAVDSDYDFFKVYVDGVVVSEIESNIQEPELFGGNESGGGWVGNFTFYSGNFDQSRDATLVSSLGTTEVPAYRGISHIVLPDNYIGESAQLRKMEFLLGRWTNSLNTIYRGHNSNGGDDINLAEALYHIITDGWSGLDIEPSKLNLASFEEAAMTLITEGNGGSLVVSSPKQGKAIVKEILRQIDGVLAENSAGEVLLKLIRFDYTPADLVVYDEDVVLEISNFSRASWRDVVSQVKVSFPSRTKDSSKIAIAQNMATLNMIGRVKTAEISFPFCYEPLLAATLAARELAQLSVPIISLTAVMNRNAYALTVGEVLKLTFPEFGISELICRVQRVNLGELEDNKIIVDLVQDTFAVATTVMAAPEDTGWTNQRPEPVSGVTGAIVDMPYFLGQQLEVPLDDGKGNVIPFPIEPQVGSTGFSLTDDVTSGYPLGYTDPTSIAYPVTGLLNASFGQTDGFATGVSATGVTIKTVLNGPPTSATSAQVLAAEAGIMYIGGEWMSYEGVTNNGDGTFTLDTVNRGLFGTTPLTHAEDARLYILTPELLGAGYISAVLTEDGTLYYKFLDEVGGTRKDPQYEVQRDVTLVDIPDRPLRPRDLKIDGVRTTNFAPIAPVDLTWVNSNRTETEVTLETDATETPDQTEQYNIEVWVDEVEDVSFNADNITSPYTIDLTTAVGGRAELRLYSQRTAGDTKASAYYAFYPIVLAGLEKLSGDMQSGEDILLTSGDAQSGIDGIQLSGDEE